MKKRTLLAFMAITLCTGMQAQETGNSYKTTYQSQSVIERFKSDITTSAVCENKGHRMLSFGGNIGYEFLPKIYAFAHGESVTGLHDIGGMKTYTNTCNIGGGLGYKLFISSITGKNPSHDNSIDIYALMAASVGNTEWKQTVYEAGLKWKITKGISPILGLGFRHTNSHTAGVSNHNGIICSIGFGI
ncbi:hypothetical protein [Xylanibacter rodentium]|uniref:hypothetical protein n=1 Tax=Xylanibacter rodentium TaxID=2736289 RepID=UPI00258E94B3|nr:hypothetical protein [Xylanibacter rodentium]